MSAANEIAGKVDEAMQRAFNLGQTYWQQADSQYASDNRKSEETRAKFMQVKAESVEAVQKEGERFLAIFKDVTSVRDQFAKAAMQGYLASYGPDDSVNMERLARFAFQMADAMMTERLQTTKEAAP